MGAESNARVVKFPNPGMVRMQTAGEGWRADLAGHRGKSSARPLPGDRAPAEAAGVIHSRGHPADAQSRFPGLEETRSTRKVADMDSETYNGLRRRLQNGEFVATGIAGREDGLADSENPGGFRPRRNDCHGNVERWIEEGRGGVRVRGWLVISQVGGFLLDKHSVVGTCGGLLDITRTPDQPGFSFLPHLGEDTEFDLLAAQIQVRP